MSEDIDPRYEMHSAQLQFWAEIGTMDSGGIGHMDSIEISKPFPSRVEAEQYLTDNGWIYNNRTLRRMAVKEGKPYGMTRIREVKEFRFEKWIKAND